MRNIKIITDSCSDMPKKFRDQYDIDVINLSVYFQGAEVTADLDWKGVSEEDLYSVLEKGNRVWTLSATELEIKTKINKYIRDDYDVIYVSSCDKQSSTYSKAVKIKDDILSKHPEARIEVIDTLNQSAGITICVLHAARCLENGMDFDSIVESTLNMRKSVMQFATVETLTYLSRTSKINARSAAIGNLLNLKPILISDKDGNQVGISRVRGRKESVDEVVRLFLENVVNPNDQEIFIVHGHDKVVADYVKKKIVEGGIKDKNINILCAGPLVGITAGPGMVGLFGIGKDISSLGE